tara:strand:+ start:450 stop:710 length:261 start_codon:yes stop_codon:yes gene_type:complete
MGSILELLVSNVFSVLQILLVVRVVMSWIPHNGNADWAKTINSITDIILRPIQENLPTRNMGFDFSPVIAFFLLGVLKNIILSIAV